jgi:hypothetical protein
MGSEDLFHKLKAKAKKTRKRAHEQKEPYAKFLIVCEDTVSGYYYLLDAVKHFKLSTANFKIVGLGQSPINIVQEAERRYNEEEESHRPNFEKVFCVFDRDNHSTYYNALGKIDALNKKVDGNDVFEAIPSNPCFEIWLILHFKYTTKYYSQSQKKSAANQVVKDLEAHIAGYRKADRDVFSQTVKNLNEAIARAEKLENHSKNTGTDVPSTQAHKLMAYIRDLKA